MSTLEDRRNSVGIITGAASGPSTQQTVGLLPPGHPVGDRESVAGAGVHRPNNVVTAEVGLALRRPGHPVGSDEPTQGPGVRPSSFVYAAPKAKILAM